MARVPRKKGSAGAEAADGGRLPSQTKGDTVQAIVRVGMSILPAGGAVAELIDLVIKPALNRRRDDWFNGLADDVQKLKDRPSAPTIEELSANDAFVTVMLNASAAAMRTHQQEKLAALRAAVINTALAMAPDEHMQLMFIRFIDELAPLHLRILRYLQDPGRLVTPSRHPTTPGVVWGVWHVAGAWATRDAWPIRHLSPSHRGVRRKGSRQQRWYGKGRTR